MTGGVKGRIITPDAFIKYCEKKRYKHMSKFLKAAATGDLDEFIKLWNNDPKIINRAGDEQALLKAAKHNRLIIVQYILENYNRYAEKQAQSLDDAYSRKMSLVEYITMTNSSHYSPLTHAVRNDNVEMVEALLQNGANPNSLISYYVDGFGPFYQIDFIDALKRGNVGVVKAFLEKGLNFNIFASHISNRVLCNNNTEVVKALLEKGADVKLFQKSLLSAAASNDLKIVNELLSYGIEIDNYISSYLYYEKKIYDAQKKHPEVLEALFREDETKKTKNKCLAFSLLCVAAQIGDLEMLNGLLAKGADPNHGISYNLRTNPLMGAVSRGDLQMVNALLEKGADPNIICDHSTPLECAMRRNDTKIFMALLNKKADPHYNVYHMDNPLHWAIKYNHKDIFYALLKIPTDLNLPLQGQTPLMCAMYYDDMEKFNALLKAGADPNLIGHSNFWYGNVSPLMFAVKKRNLPMVEALLAKGAATVVHSSCITMRDDMKRDTDKGRMYSILILAIKTGDVGIVKALLDNGADLNFDCYYGGSPVSLAMQGGHDEIAKELLLRGALISHGSSFQLSAIKKALHKSHNRDKRYYELIINAIVDQLCSDEDPTYLRKILPEYFNDIVKAQEEKTKLFLGSLKEYDSKPSTVANSIDEEYDATDTTDRTPLITNNVPPKSYLPFKFKLKMPKFLLTTAHKSNETMSKPDETKDGLDNPLWKTLPANIVTEILHNLYGDNEFNKVKKIRTKLLKGQELTKQEGSQNEAGAQNKEHSTKKDKKPTKG